MLPKSIRWQLPLSYAAIALLAALALGLALILPLRNYYAQLERDYLIRNAREIGQVLAPALQATTSNPEASTQAQALAFLVQARVRVYGASNQLILDSGSVAPRSILTFPSAPPVSPASLAQPNPPGSQSDQPKQENPALLTSTMPFTGYGGINLNNAGFPGDILFSFIVAAPVSIATSATTTATGPVPGTMVFANRSPYGFDLSADARFDARRSEQVIQQPFLDSQGNLLGNVELSEGPAYGRDIVDVVALGWMIASTIAVLVAAGAGLLISRRISVPLITLTELTTRMATGDLTVRAGLRRKDELGTLASSFNQMADRIESTVSTLRHFVSDAAHEINTPLTALRTRLDLAEQYGNPDDVRAAREQAVRLEQLTSGLLDLSRIESAAGRHMQPLDFAGLLREVSEPFASRAEQRGVSLALNAPDQEVIVEAVEEQLRRATSNLLDNAVKFTPAGGSVIVTMAAESDRVRLIVEDTGIGIPVGELPRLFERFHRASNASSYPGNGLGLAMVKAIIEQHGGEVFAMNTPKGARFGFWLPRI